MVPSETMDRGVTSEKLGNVASNLSGLIDSTAAHFLGCYCQQGKVWKDLACLWMTICLKCPDMCDTQDSACSWIKTLQYLRLLLMQQQLTKCDTVKFLPLLYSPDHTTMQLLSLSRMEELAEELSIEAFSWFSGGSRDCAAGGRIWWIPEMFGKIGRGRCGLGDAN